MFYAYTHSKWVWDGLVISMNLKCVTLLTHESTHWHQHWISNDEMSQMDPPRFLQLTHTSLRCQALFAVAKHPCDHCEIQEWTLFPIFSPPEKAAICVPSQTRASYERVYVCVVISCCDCVFTWDWNIKPSPSQEIPLERNSSVVFILNTVFSLLGSALFCLFPFLVSLHLCFLTFFFLLHPHLLIGWEIARMRSGVAQTTTEPQS